MSPAWAEDFAEQFLSKLRERGWHDVAEEYLEHASDDPLASREFLEKTELELAITRRELARQTLGEKQRQALLTESITGLEKFITENPTSSDRLTAQSQLGNLLADQALATLGQAEKITPFNSGEPLRMESRAQLEAATSVLAELEETLTAQLASLDRESNSERSRKDVLELKQGLENKQAEARFLLANLNFEKARTFPPESADRREVLEAAAEGFARLNEQYENKLVGFYAQFYEGRCYQEQGNCRQALKMFDKLMSSACRPG